MNNVGTFLLDYYVWILVVLAVIIITIIGFLVDSKQKRRKKETKESEGLSEVKTVESLPNDVETLNIGNQDASINISQLQPVQQAVQNGVNSSNVPLNNQVPHIMSNNVSLPKQDNVDPNNNMVPRPVASVPINQTMQQNRINVSQVPNVQYGYQVNNTGTYSSYGNNNVSNMTPNYNSLSQTVPNQNVMVQPNVMQNSGYTNNVNGLNQNFQIQQNDVNSNTGVTNNTQSSSQVQKVFTTPGIGMNFVTGYSENVEDDTWKL